MFNWVTIYNIQKQANLMLDWIKPEAQPALQFREECFRKKTKRKIRGLMLSHTWNFEFRLANRLLNYTSQTTPELDCLVVDNQDKFVEPSSQIIWLDKYIKGICKFSSPIYAQIPWGEQVFDVADYWCWWPDEVLQLSLCRLLCKSKGNTVNIGTGQN